ncbi:MAG TPA: transketolase, partial [Chitinophagales bacterium]|nr:transketolase [Chitinophagales bacterium]
TQLQQLATQIRRDVLRMTHGAASGHPGGSLGCADFFAALYFNIMRYTPNAFTMDGIGEDVFFLSNGHISPVLYSTLARAGYFPLSELATFRKINSRLQGHPATKEGLPGVRIASGSLGQGLSVAAGAALAKKLNGDDHLVYVLMGDGELQEGQNWEAAMFAAHHRIDNIIATVDWNGQQIDGATDEVMSLGNLVAKWQAFGWHVIQMKGNDMKSILSAMSRAHKLCGNTMPILLLMTTEMGKGVDFMEGTHKWHGVAPNDEQLERALAQLPETLGDY